MKFWISTCILLIGFLCLKIADSSSKHRCIMNIYAKEFHEELPGLTAIPNTDSGSVSWEASDSDQDKSDFQTCDIHERMKSKISNNPENNPNGFSDCEPSQPIKCDPNYPYRTMNGKCNNLRYPLWGAANQCFRRHLPAVYTGFDNFRKSVTGALLPEPRQLTLSIFQNHHNSSEDVSLMYTIYGQTIAHDISLANFEIPQTPCCAPENVNHSVCKTMLVPPSDPFYAQFNVTCLSFTRTVACNACNTNKRQQNTQQTAAMDASIVYGPDDNIAYGLRTNDGTGKLLSNYTKIGELLPSGNNPQDTFCPMLKKYKCFQAGDSRINQHAALTSMQTVYMREHNRIAEELKKLNPNWNDERLYQEARRINIAQLQNINFQEHLPHLLGHYYMSKFDLQVKNGSGGTRYNPEVQLGVWNEFSTAAFRIHSMIATDVGALNLQFVNLFSNPGLLWKGHAGEILNGATSVPSEKFDRWFVNDVTDFITRKNGAPYGSDLAARDVQRGRDHGIAPYVHYVYFCSDGQVDIQSFDDLVNYEIISNEGVMLLKRNYAKVQDVDLYVGLQLEHDARGAKVGPTAVCIIARQYYHLKYGDRFYFEHIGEAGSFTAAQRTSIKQASLSRLLCDNTYISEVQLNSMLLPSNSNFQVKCSDIPKIRVYLLELFLRLIQNPGTGVNFYGKIQNIPPSKQMYAKNAFEDLVHEHCSKMSSNSSCIRKLLYHYPDILCEIRNPIPCDYSYLYRKIDGTCNNPHISRLGMVNQCFERFIPAYYDGHGDFRKSVTGEPLPEPRDLSLEIFKDHHRPTVNVTFQFATFAEFLAIDILLSVSPSTDCCSEKNANKPECKPISVRPDDPFYSEFNKTCIDFQRTEQCACNTRQLKHNDSSVGCLLPSGKGPNDLFCPKEKNTVLHVRKITIAEHQCIVFKDFLPLLLSPRIVEEFNLTVPDGAKGIRYNPNIILEQPGVHYGQDLASINIQRGRDHGLPPYIQIVKFCSEGAIIISSFDDLYKLGLMSKDNADLLRHLLAVEDIDMWVGIQLEYHMPGAITGPSAVCINAKQFYFNQKGDRFYFDIEGPGAPFTDERSHFNIKCRKRDNTVFVTNFYILGIKRKGEYNQECGLEATIKNSAVSCDEIPKIDLTLWKENENSITT
ncbi:Peroxidase like protein [Argiope bruennichi]|uniref:Peroxidase like protein n=1 Tax=Argiope bruennichi TaxID=94029 RepID=A0A8T0EFT5_ARGBR|nr:Peroxidase like protein [Argiope bruennichi]